MKTLVGTFIIKVWGCKRDVGLTSADETRTGYATVTDFYLISSDFLSMLLGFNNVFFSPNKVIGTELFSTVVVELYFNADEG